MKSEWQNSDPNMDVSDPQACPREREQNCQCYLTHTQVPLKVHFMVKNFSLGALEIWQFPDMFDLILILLIKSTFFKPFFEIWKHDLTSL